MKAKLPALGAERTFSLFGSKYSITGDFDGVWIVRDIGDRDEPEPVCLIFARRGGYVVEVDDRASQTPDWWQTLKQIVRGRAQHPAVP